jgi:hypothetical protein
MAERRTELVNSGDVTANARAHDVPDQAADALVTAIRKFSMAA